METEFFLGAIDDPRSEEDKQKDYHEAEVVAGAPAPTWRTKKAPNGLQFDMRPDTWRRFPTRDQDGSSTCVAQTTAKLLGIEEYRESGKFITLSARDMYDRRVNKNWENSEGMVGTDAGNIPVEHGVTLEELLPSQKMNEQAITKPVVRSKTDIELARIFAAGGFLQPSQDIDAIASVIERTNKGVMVWFRFGRDEWFGQQEARILIQNPPWHHSVAAVDFTLNDDGEKCLVIEDSSSPHTGFDGGQRLVPLSFFKKRNTFALYFVDKENWTKVPAQTPKPTYRFTKPLEFIPWSDMTNAPLDEGKHDAQKADVVALQNILKYEGLMPLQTQSTGYYGAITAKAVDAFQRKHRVDFPAVLDELQGKRVGTLTIAVLNRLYA